jgi:hypothetical protein
VVEDMEVKVIKKENTNIAIISSDDVIIKNSQDALDLIATISYEYDCNKMIINKKNITEDFFELKNGIAGEIMQKYINYAASLGIVGEFNQYNSVSLKSLIYESNKNKRIIFISTKEDAIALIWAV